MESRGAGSRTQTERSATQAGEATKDAARELATSARDVAEARAQTLFESNREAAVSRMEGVAEILRSASSDRDRQDGVAAVARRLADRLEGASRTLSHRELSGVLRDAEQYARREPAIFFGGAFAVGFALARFLKASATRQDGREDRHAPMSGPSSSMHEDSPYI